MTDDVSTAMLHDDQMRRAQALRIAAEVYDHHLPKPSLISSAPLSPRQKVSHRVWALTTLSTYVLDGAEEAAAEWVPGEVEPEATVLPLPDGWMLFDGAKPEPVPWDENDPAQQPCRDVWCTRTHMMDTPCDVKATPVPDDSARAMLDEEDGDEQP